MKKLDKINHYFREALLETVPCAVFMVDQNHQVIYWNNSAEEITGYNESEIVGQTCEKLRLNICANQDPETRKTFCPLLSGGNYGEVECEMRKKDGSVVPVMRKSRPVFDDQNQIIGAIEALIDVSLIKQARTEIRLLKHEIARRGKFGQMVGRSEKMQRLYELIQVVSKNDANILIEGETGTGKELVAKTIHSESNRSDKIFLAVNCGALTQSLLEAELFGHRKGAFTGAVENREGCFETAFGGTLFLDEIGEMPLSSQVKLLRVLQEKEVTRVGESLPRPIDVRVIAASNKKLSDLVNTGQFRDDLYYRLHVVELNVPPLRERKEDLQDLISHFISQFNEEYNKSIEGCSPQAMDRFINHNWPGNIRELEHVIEHAFAVTTSSQKVITFDSLPATLTGPNKPFSKVKSAKTRDFDERSKLEEVLAKAEGNKSQAARMLGITRAGLYKKLRRFGL
ncbi:Transcriptional regulatory protein ZraR [Limihaloglobus sulfuriphilus]|uniref:Transcriptional regulatory protein ZraR n=1 Tax=Limihaloglobus sulfuriphilus TaxID=1851148 RepID=A0A1Q2MGI2_9BACT|nr:sigma 54-interacting transcriptional regulator [Limihaloglobus sulfuriphilus]AQQ71790.1 Transcriptional regulatory protein ZraR [Limihaloglobus sulfuriphilus]